MDRKKQYTVKLIIERLNDGKYKAELAMNGAIETLGYVTRDELFEALDGFKKDLTNFETQLDES